MEFAVGYFAGWVLLANAPIMMVLGNGHFLWLADISAERARLHNAGRSHAVSGRADPGGAPGAVRLPGPTVPNYKALMFSSLGFLRKLVSRFLLFFLLFFLPRGGGRILDAVTLNGGSRATSEITVRTLMLHAA